MRLTKTRIVISLSVPQYEFDNRDIYGFTARAIASAVSGIATAKKGKNHRHFLVILLTGQPILISAVSAPSSTCMQPLLLRIGATVRQLQRYCQMLISGLPHNLHFDIVQASLPDTHLMSSHPQSQGSNVQTAREHHIPVTPDMTTGRTRLLLKKMVQVVVRVWKACKVGDRGNHRNWR